MRTIPFAALVVFGLATVSSVAFGGCTSVLGDFEVSSDTATGDAGGGDGGEACAICNGQCVDLKTNTLNCGACGIACLGGQVCSDSKCACAPDKAFCAGACTPADRKHCGSSCQECQADEICTGSCQTAPQAAFDGVPRTPTGWLDENGKAISFKIHEVGPGTKYECRTAPVKSFASPTNPPWRPCDGAQGTGLVHTPTEDAVVPEGTYRTEMRYRNDTYLSEAAVYEFYVHHHLDKVATCPRAGQDDGPHFNDAQYFQSVLAWVQMTGGEGFDVNSNFPAPGPDIELRNPFIKIPFQGVRSLPHMTGISAGVVGSPPWPPLNTAANWVVNDLSLRHKFVMNATRTMMLVKRQYIRPQINIPKPHGGDCKNLYEFGTNLSKKTAPLGVVRGKHYVDCEALVLNPHGQGLCMTKGPNGPEPMLVDQSPDASAAGPYPAYNISVAASVGATQVVPSSSFTNPAGYKNYYVQLLPKKGKWYKIVDVVGGAWKLDQPLAENIPAGTPIKWSSQLIQRHIVPAAFAKLYQNQHGAAPANGTKCTTLGCADNRNWLTYLPP